MLARAPKDLLSWSSGKDSVWALHLLLRRGEDEVVGLLTTFNEAADRVAMHAVRRELVEAQAAAAGMPLYPVMLAHSCTNEVYEARMRRRSRRPRAGASPRWPSATCASKTSGPTGSDSWMTRAWSRCSRPGPRCMRRPPWLGGCRALA